MTAADRRALAWADPELHRPALGASRLPAELDLALSEVVDAAREREQMPGLLAAVADRSGTLMWHRRAGVGHLRPTRAPALDAAVRIGSISKTMTALLVMQLVDDGHLDLDDNVISHLTSLHVGSPDGSGISVQQLLTHASGLGDDPCVDLGCAPGAKPTLSDVYGPALIGQGPPGAVFGYSNAAFAVLGQLVADVREEPLSVVAIRRIFDPLGMRQTSYTRDARIRTPWMNGLDVIDGELREMPYSEVATPGAGSVWSTVHDLALYGAAMHGRGANRHGRVLSETAFDILTTPAKEVTGVPLPPWASTLRPCLGWMQVDTASSSWLWHNGGWPGARSELAVLLEQGWTLMAFTNTLNADADSMCSAMAALLQ